MAEPTIPTEAIGEPIPAMSAIATGLTSLLERYGVGGRAGFLLGEILLAVAVVLLAIAVNWLTKRVLVAGIHRVVLRSRSEWDDLFLEHGVFTRISHLAPALVIYYSAPLFPPLAGWISQLAIAYMALAGLFVVDAALNAGHAIYQTLEIARTRPIRGYIQAIKVFLYVVAGIVALATLMNQSPWKLLSGIGALTAIVLLVFRDSILGLVASIQLTANDMVRPGDWIEMPKYGADGDVIDMSLQTVKVRNWDKTITTIPTYALVSDSYKNWRGMEEAGGRRIKRAIYIDMNSVKFCTDEMIEKFRRFNFLQEYIDARLAEIEAYNREHGFDMSQLVNGRRMTNLGTFRAYLVQYLRHHPKVHQEMTLLVRHLAPTPSGLPIEIYLFTNDIAWANYESIQADIFDHILAVLPEFELRVFQSPTGHDLQGLADAATGFLRSDDSDTPVSEPAPRKENASS